MSMTLLTTKQAAEFLGIAPRTMIWRKYDGRIPVQCIFQAPGCRVRYVKEELAKLGQVAGK
jgi:predicted site-specific integrase-resolvase